MVSDRRGFLWEDERNYIDAATGGPRAGRDVPEINEEDETIALPNEFERRTRSAENVNQPSQTRYRLKSGLGSPKALAETFREFENDLRRTESFYCEMEEQPGGRYHWRDKMLGGAEAELQQLHEYLGVLLNVAEKNEGEWVRGELHEAIDPIRDGLHDLRKVEQGELDSDEYDRAIRGDEDAHQGLVADREEIEERQKALAALLRDAELYEIFEFIATTPGNAQVKPLKEHQKGKNNWKWWASRNLKTKYGLIDEPANGYGFQLTERGEVVRETWDSLMAADLLEGYTGDGNPSKAEAALHYLASHFGAHDW